MVVRPIQPPDLVSMRRKKGISLAQISASTKIGSRYLEAIEAGDFEKLPGGIYNTSYLRQYAQAIDYDETDLVEYYYRKTGNYPDLPPAAPPAAARRGFVQLFRSQVLRVLG